MTDTVSVKKNISLKTVITVKSLVSVALVALAVALPRLVHLVAGAEGGIKWLPMYFPVLLADACSAFDGDSE